MALGFVSSLTKVGQEPHTASTAGTASWHSLAAPSVQLRAAVTAISYSVASESQSACSEDPPVPLTAAPAPPAPVLLPTPPVPVLLSVNDWPQATSAVADRIEAQRRDRMRRDP